MNNLKAVRDEHDWSQARAVAEIQAQARSEGIEIPGSASLKTQLSRWENGHRQPDPFYRRLLERAYRCTAVQLGLEPEAEAVLAALEVGRTWQTTARTASDLWDQDMQRRELLHSATFAASAFAAPTLSALVHTSGAQPTRPEGDRPVGNHDVRAIREMRDSFASIDNRHGGGQVRRAAVAYLTEQVAPMLRRGRFNQETGQALFAAAAELTQLVGWMSHDVGAHGLGQRYLIQALGLAEGADDSALMGEILAAMSHQATYLGDGAQAIDLARAAGQIARGRGLSVLIAEAHVMEAHGHAALQDSASCVRALDSAEHALDEADRGADPHWIGYFDEAYLSAKFGHCFRALGDHDNAIRFAQRSLNMNSRDYARGHAFNLGLLADSYARAGRVEEACAVGHDAVTATEGLRSDRAITYLRQLRTSLQPATESRTVQALDHRLAPLFATAA